MMRALSMMAVALCGLVFTACYDHEDGTSVVVPEPVAQAGDGPLLDRVVGDQGPVIFDHSGHMGFGFACTDCHHTVPADGFASQGCVGCHPVPSDDDPAHGGPDDNTVLAGDTQDTAELPGVPFNHYTHGSSRGYKLACESCHHMGGNIPCDTCHGDLSKQQGEQVVPKLKRAMHLQCTGCHESLVGSDPSSIAPVDCDTCHSERELERLDGALSFERAAHLSCVSCHREVKAERPAAPVSCTGCHIDDAAAPVPVPSVDEDVPCETEECAPPTVDGDEAPADGEEVPSDVEEVPVDGDEAPADGDEAPADGDEAPADGDEAPAASGGPADVVWPGTMGTVTFRHSAHGTMGCDGCHPGMAPMTSDKLGMEKGHGACSTCHAEVTGDCAKCHVQ